MKSRILFITAAKSTFIQDVANALGSDKHEFIMAQSLEEAASALLFSSFHVIVVVESPLISQLPKKFDLMRVPLQITPILLVQGEQKSFFRKYVYSILDQNLTTKTDAPALAEILEEVILSSPQTSKFGKLEDTPLFQVLYWAVQAKISVILNVETPMQSFQVQISKGRYEIIKSDDETCLEESLTRTQGVFSVIYVPESSVILSDRAKSINIPEAPQTQSQNIPSDLQTSGRVGVQSALKRNSTLLVGLTCLILGLTLGRFGLEWLSASRTAVQPKPKPKKEAVFVQIIPTPTAAPTQIATVTPATTSTPLVVEKSVETPAPRPTMVAAPTVRPAATPDPILKLLAQGNTLMNKGDLPGARKIFEMVMDKSPKNAEAQLAMGTLNMLEENTDHAREYFKNYLKLVKPSKANKEQIAEVERVLKELK